MKTIEHLRFADDCRPLSDIVLSDILPVQTNVSADILDSQAAEGHSLKLHVSSKLFEDIGRVLRS